MWKMAFLVEIYNSDRTPYAQSYRRRQPERYATIATTCKVFVLLQDMYQRHSKHLRPPVTMVVQTPSSKTMIVLVHTETVDRCRARVA